MNKIFIPDFTIPSYYKYYLIIYNNTNTKTNVILGGTKKSIIRKLNISERTLIRFFNECNFIYKNENDEYCFSLFNKDVISTDTLKNVSGIYRLYKDGCVVYLGKTKNIQGRIKNHITDGKKGFDSFDYAICLSESDKAIYELYYIAKLKPIYNKQDKFDDVTTIILKDLEFSNITYV